MAKKHNVAFATMLLMTTITVVAAEYPLLRPSEHYNWSDVMEVPTGATFEGNQVLHFTGNNKPYKNDPKAYQIVNTYFKEATALDADAEVLRFASDAVSITGGYFIEMGVGTGRSINFIAALNPTKKVYGFDSFEGLPTDWDKGDKVFKAGMFGLKRKDAKIPLVKNVIVYKGMFKEVLPQFKNQVLKNEPIALLHVDSDTYESAKDTFKILGENIMPGTVIVFDEFYNYPRFEEYEWKAFQEFVKERKLKIQYVAFNKNHEQVAVKIV